MGLLGSSGPALELVGNVSFPVYAVKCLGSRFMLIAGGGGMAKTGVANMVEAFLMTYRPDDNKGSDVHHLRLVQAGSTKTGDRATMNMDVIGVGDPANNVFLLACGQDDFTTAYLSSTVTENKELRLQFKQISQLNTVTADPKDPGQSYQKCCRFFPPKDGSNGYLITGGSDSVVRFFKLNIHKLTSDSVLVPDPDRRIDFSNGDIDDIDVCVERDAFSATVSDGRLAIHSIVDTTLRFQVTPPEELKQGYKARCLRFVRNPQGSAMFLVAYNPIQRNKRSKCFVSVWICNNDMSKTKCMCVKEVATGDAISSLTVSECGTYAAIGTLAGSVGVYDSHSLKRLMWNFEAHSIFVTGLSFVPRVARDIRLEKTEVIPGPAAAFRACVLSLSADQQMQMHYVYPDTHLPLTTLIMIISLVMLLINIFIYFFV